jgi:uncharacterized protein YjbI with pentapeptide repeats
VATWFAIRLASGWFYRPPGWPGFVLWCMQAIALAAVVGVLTDRLTRRFIPLASLLAMSLTFPDNAPSRFGIALRTGTMGKLQDRLDEWNATGLSADENTAAGQAVELVTLLGRHERLTRGHTERVRAYADLIAAEMEVSEVDRQKLAWASLLHDIGKLTVPAEILNKNGRPTDEEWEILQTHPAAGEAFIEPLADWLGEWRYATSQHHERWDGRGYPCGLAGTDISLAGRIVAVADAYDVITTKRSYKEPMSAEAARREMVACAGAQFDPVVVRALLNVSLNKQRGAAWMAWLLELPGAASVARVVTSVPTAAAASVVALGATMAVPPPDVGPPDNLAFDGQVIELDESAFEEPTDPFVIPTPTPTPPASPQSNPTADPTPSSRALPTGFVIPTPTPTPSSAERTGGNGFVIPTPTPRPAGGTAPNRSESTPTPTPAGEQATGPTPTPLPTPTTTPTPPPTPTPDDCSALLSGELELAGAYLVGCDLSGIRVDEIDLTDANLTGADLSGAWLTEFNLDGAVLVGADLSGASLTQGSLVGANATNIDASGLWLTQVSLSFATLTGSDFTDADFVGVDFNDAVIDGADFSRAWLGGVRFQRSSAVSALFTDAYMRQARLDNADFTLAVLDGADLRHAVVANTRIDRASLVETSFRQATGVPLSPGTAYYQSTRCPDASVSNVTCWP